MAFPEVIAPKCDPAGRNTRALPYGSSLLPLTGDQRAMVGGFPPRGGDLLRQRRVQVPLVGQPQQLGLGDGGVPQPGERTAKHRSAPVGPTGAGDRLDAAREPGIDLIRRRTVTWVASKHTVFARLLGRSGFDESRVRYEVVGHVRHGPVDAAPDYGGVVALLANATLGWAVARHAGWIEPSWISSWSATPGALTIDYLPAPVVVHHHDPHDLKLRFGDPARLQLSADEAEIAELIRLTGATLPNQDH